MSGSSGKSKPCTSLYPFLWTMSVCLEHLLASSKLRWIEHIFRLKRRVRDRRKVRVRKAVGPIGVFRQGGPSKLPTPAMNSRRAWELVQIVWDWNRYDQLVILGARKAWVVVSWMGMQRITPLYPKVDLKRTALTHPDFFNMLIFILRKTPVHSYASSYALNKHDPNWPVPMIFLWFCTTPGAASATSSRGITLTFVCGKRDGNDGMETAQVANIWSNDLSGSSIMIRR